MSALVHFPITFAMVADLQEPVFRIVPFPALRALHVTAPRSPMTVVIFCDSEGRAATARHEKHLEGRGATVSHYGHTRSTIRLRQPPMGFFSVCWLAALSSAGEATWESPLHIHLQQ